MGRGIALIAAMSGCDTRLVDVSETQLKAAMEYAHRYLANEVRRGRRSEDGVDPVLARLQTSTKMSQVIDGSVDVVIEAVVEDLQVKQEVMTAAEAGLEDHALVATNTSALSVTQIAAYLRNPARCLGMHFFNPVPRLRLCEIVRAVQTSEESITQARQLAELLGKHAIVVEDVPGFATSRLSALLGNEAFRMLEEGVASAENIDDAVRVGLNHPMGPLELGDLVGLDVRLAVLEHLAATLGDRFRPTTTHRRLVAAGFTGRKAGRGVYSYDDDGHRTESPG